MRGRLIGLFVSVALAGGLSAGAGAALAASANKGLAAGVAVPSWAAHRPVHFLPGPPRAGVAQLRSALSQQSVPAVEEETGQVANTDPPALYHERGYGVQHSPHVYVIFWGSAWNEATGSALRAQLLKMYRDLTGSSFQGILTQYFDSTGRVSSTVSVASYTDEGVAAPTSVNDEKIREEAAKAIATNGWPRELDSQFVVLPAPGATYEAGFDTGFCGYHGFVEEREFDRDYSYTFIPYVGDEPFHAGCIAYDEGENPDHVTSMAASHEYAESATDPGTDTWFTEEGYEIADICATRDTEVQEGPLRGAWVQGLWDDDQSECLLSDPEPPHVYAVTEEGTDLQPHEIELSGVIDPEGLETRYHFEYGPTTSYGTDIPTPDASAGSTVSNVNVTETVKDLPEGIYHYRLVATNSSGTTDGKDRLAIAPGFSTQTLPQPPGSSEQHEAEGVSCVSPQTCIAVGTYWNMEAQAKVTLAEAFDDGTWSVQPTPTPAGATRSILRGVSCMSASECTAVGYYKNSSGTDLTLAERWNGGEWTIQPTPNQPGTSESELLGVSCPSASECTTVGYYKNGSGTELTLAERWNGTEWSIESTPNSGGASGSRLMSVSCPTRNACVAGGFSSGAYTGGSRSLIERWNGSEWATQTVDESEGSAFFGVSCTSPGACTAVGAQTRAGTAQTLAERWNGSEWSVQPTYSSLELSGLNAVSCISSTECVAVGSYWDMVSTSPASEVLAERWNGSEWTQAAMLGLPRSPGMWRDSILNAVSCTESAACLAVGETIAAPFGNLGYAVGFAEREFAAPTTATETASGETYDEATLSGTVNPQALETSYRFEYGPTTSYGATAPVPEASAGSAVGRVGVSETIEGLQPQATYHYRLVASNAAGTTHGEDETFTTAAPPPPGEHLVSDHLRKRVAGSNAHRGARRLDERSDGLRLSVAGLRRLGCELLGDRGRDRPDLHAHRGGRGSHDPRAGNRKQRRRYR